MYNTTVSVKCHTKASPCGGTIIRRWNTWIRVIRDWPGQQNLCRNGSHPGHTDVWLVYKGNACGGNADEEKERNTLKYVKSERVKLGHDIGLANGASY